MSSAKEASSNGGGEEKATEKEVPWICTKRVALALVAFLGFVNLYALRVNMSVAMVCMVNHTAINERYMASQGNVTQHHYQPVSEGNDTVVEDEHRCSLSAANTKKQIMDGEFDWDKETQGILLGGFFWGYIVTQIPGGLLSQRFGGKRVFGYFMLLAAIATLFSSLSARVSPYLLLFMRIINGVGQGVVFPAVHDIWAKWAPPLERSKLIGFSHAGAQIGNVLTFPLSAILCDYGFDNGWGSIFYVFGIVGIVWFCLWMFIAADTPAQHRSITKGERDYIETSLGTGQIPHIPMRDTPWRAFATSMPVWAIVVAHTCSNWGTYTLLTNMPAYMKEVLKFDIKSNGLFSAIPYLVFWLCINIGGVIADYLRQHGWQTKTVRKIMLAVGNIGPAILLIATGFVPCTSAYLAIGVLSLATGCIGFQFPGALVNHVDIAPPFAGVLFGISNTVATIPGFISPYVVKRLTVHSTQAEWQIVFYIAAAIYAVGCTFYCVFADGEIQDWVKPYLTQKDQELKEVLPGKLAIEPLSINKDEDISKPRSS